MHLAEGSKPVRHIYAVPVLHPSKAHLLSASPCLSSQQGVLVGILVAVALSPDAASVA